MFCLLFILVNKNVTAHVVAKLGFTKHYIYSLISTSYSFYVLSLFSKPWFLFLYFCFNPALLSLSFILMSEVWKGFEEFGLCLAEKEHWFNVAVCWGGSQVISFYFYDWEAEEAVWVWTVVQFEYWIFFETDIDSWRLLFFAEFQCNVLDVKL